MKDALVETFGEFFFYGITLVARGVWSVEIYRRMCSKLIPIFSKMTLPRSTSCNLFEAHH